VSWRSAASIRVRLTGWYAIVLSLMLVIYATATFLAVRHEFAEQLDDQLHDDFESAEGYLAPAPDGRVIWSGDRRHDPDNDEDRGSDVWSASGDRIYRSGASAALPPVALAATGAEQKYESILFNGHRWRTMTGTVLVGGRSVVLRVCRSEDRLRQQMQEVVTVLVLGFPLVVVLAGGGGYLLARRALAPIDHLAIDARRITAERLHERLWVPNQHDEIGRLASVINDTFARLESSFGQLRRFTADASHELRTPLSVIRGIGESGLAETRTPAEYKEAIGSMLEEVDRLTTLVDTLLRLSYGDAGTVRLSRTAFDRQRDRIDDAARLGFGPCPARCDSSTSACDDGQRRSSRPSGGHHQRGG
jgi:signal transduction histidine kinase